MLNLWTLVANSLWVLGLAVLLATWSYAYYEAQATGRKTGQILGQAGYRLALLVGLLLFIAGMLLTDDRWWAKALWLALGVAVVANTYLRNKSSESSDDSRPRHN